jgi:hypothetical protein
LFYLTAALGKKNFKRFLFLKQRKKKSNPPFDVSRIPCKGGKAHCALLNTGLELFVLTCFKFSG